MLAVLWYALQVAFFGRLTRIANLCYLEKASQKALENVAKLDCTQEKQVRLIKLVH